MLRGQIMAVNGTAAADVSAIPDVAWVLRGDRGLTYGREAPEGGRLLKEHGGHQTIRVRPRFV